MSMIVLESGAGMLVLEAAPDGAPRWRHCGLRVSAATLPPLAMTRTPASFSLDRDCPIGLAPVAGEGWFGPQAVQVRRDGRGLALAWTQCALDAAAHRLTATMTDTAAGVALTQTIIAEHGGFRFGARLTNRGDTPLVLDWLASAVLPLPGSAERLVSWRGRHNAELVEVIEPVPAHRWQREGRRGITGHGGASGLYVLGEGAGWHSGEVLAAQLAWSGDARVAVERDDEGFHVLSLGAVPQPGEIVLAPGEGWSAPDALIALSDAGRNGAAAVQHAIVRAMIAWPGGAMRARKVHCNSWEACYFDHDARGMLDLARAAAAVGVERFVLDDGWFAGRASDRAGLGDWRADPAKYPQGLAPLAHAVRALGMEFGLWVEPEMVNPDSALYRAHPEWALHAEGRPLLTARNQLVLDMAQGAVRDYLFDSLDAILRSVPVGYLKWDHNRDLVPAGGAAQLRGTYMLLDRVRSAHPMVEIESCAGGGGRSDAGMVPYVHRFWTSDCIDAVSRVAMQRGFLAFLPPEMMGSHVGASPAHATGRSQALAFRAAVALTGHFGIELDPAALDAQDRAALARWIGYARAIGPLVHGRGVWLGEGHDGLVWQAHGDPGAALVLWVVRTAPASDRRPQPLRLPFCAAAGALEVTLLGLAGADHGHGAPLPALWSTRRAAMFAGDWLARAGLPLPPLRAETAALFLITPAGAPAPDLPPFPT